ncbi:hypothetical protein JW948_14895 [bacterium]|nr:hypothetical protein [bacterium]
MPRNRNADFEKRIIRFFYQDGLWDLFLGIVMLQFVLSPFLNDAGLGDFWSAAVFVPLIVLAWIVMRILKRKVVIPRLTEENIEREHSLHQKSWVRWLHFMILAGLFMGILVVWFWERQPGKWLFPAFLSGAFLVGFYMGGALLNFPRLYYYGLLTGIAIIAGEIMHQNYGIPHHGFPLVFGIVCLTMVMMGLVLLIRFIIKYPRSGLDAGV